MRSIKEKANEYAKDYLFSPLPQRAPNVHFEAGAEYVLDAIEKECKRIAQLCKNHVENPIDEEDKVDSWARLDEMEYMLKFIEQLKK